MWFFSLLRYNTEKKLLICICSQREIENNIIDTFALSTVIHQIRGQFLKMHSTDTTARFNTTEAKQSPFVDMSSPLILLNMECSDCRICGILDLDTTQTARCLEKHTRAGAAFEDGKWGDRPRPLSWGGPAVQAYEFVKLYSPVHWKCWYMLRLKSFFKVKFRSVILGCLLYRNRLHVTPNGTPVARP